jgi:hypothetical protein
MRKHAIAFVAALLVGLGACAQVDGNGQAGGTIHAMQPRPFAPATTTSLAEGYCGQFHRSAHIASEEIGWFWTDTIGFECI